VSADGRLPTQGGQDLAQNPFASLSRAGLPEKIPSNPGMKAAAGPTPPQAQPKANRGRVDITRETGGRGGKTVTVVSGFTGIGEPEKEKLAKRIRSACGCGGTVKDGQIVIQGDQREVTARILAEAGFRPVFAGG
jgi:translation initiation factor 1